MRVSAALLRLSTDQRSSPTIDNIALMSCSRAVSIASSSLPKIQAISAQAASNALEIVGNTSARYDAPSMSTSAFTFSPPQTVNNPPIRVAGKRQRSTDQIPRACEFQVAESPRVKSLQYLRNVDRLSPYTHLMSIDLTMHVVIGRQPPRRTFVLMLSFDCP